MSIRHGGAAPSCHCLRRRLRTIRQPYNGCAGLKGRVPARLASLMRMNSQIDISGILPTIQVPTLVIHRTDDAAVNVEGGRYLAKHIPGAP